MRGDDAAGPELARRLRERGAPLEAVEHEREPSDLIELWDGAALAFVVDAVVSGGRPGRVHRLEVGPDPLPAAHAATASSHAFGLREVVELARTLGRLPERLVVYGIEGESFEAGTPLSPAVSAAVDEVAEAMVGEAAALE
jgi:hydrogenase maturation protease